MSEKLTHEDIVSRQVFLSRAPRVPMVVVLDNIRSLLNVGAIFRAADGVGVQKIYLCGITGYPPQGGIAKTALGAEESVPWEYHKDAAVLVKLLKAQGYAAVALEQAKGAVPHDEYMPKCPICLVLGNEVEGVSEGVMKLCDDTVEIRMMGVKNSLNVAVAFGVAAFALRGKAGL